MEEEGRTVVVERLNNVESWELYGLMDDETPETVCKVALRADDDAGRVEYGVWRADDEDPADTGAVELDPSTDEWDDEAREDALRQIVYRYEADLGVSQDVLEFYLGLQADQDESDENHELVDHDNIEDSKGDTGQNEYLLNR